MNIKRFPGQVLTSDWNKREKAGAASLMWLAPSLFADRGFTAHRSSIGSAFFAFVPVGFHSKRDPIARSLRRLPLSILNDFKLRGDESVIANILSLQCASPADASLSTINGFKLRGDESVIANTLSLQCASPADANKTLKD